MRIKVSKLVLGNVADISVSRFNCSEDNVLKITDLFEYENVIIEIGNVEKCSSLFQTLRTLNLKYTTSLYDDLPYTDVVIMAKTGNVKEIIHHVFASECESFSLEYVTHHSQWEQHLYNRIHKRQLIKRKIITLSMVVVINESQVDISFHKDTYDAKQITAKIKALF